MSTPDTHHNEPDAYTALLNQFTQRNIDALVKCKSLLFSYIDKVWGLSDNTAKQKEKKQKLLSSLLSEYNVHKCILKLLQFVKVLNWKSNCKITAVTK